MPNPAPSDRRPAFRALEVVRVAAGPEPGVALRDPLGLFEGRVFVPEGLLPVVERIDGRRTVAEIERELRALGVAVPAGLVAGVVEDLDQALLLQGELFEATLDQTVRAFLDADVRPARHAGSAGYPVDPTACAAALDDLLGEPPPVRGGSTPPRAVLSPHVDLDRGAQVYRAVWREVAARPLADLYVVLGTGHQGPARPLTGLELDWETPAGRLTTDREFIDRLHAALGAPSDLDRFLHRGEHSIEFQMLLLAHIARRSGRAEAPRVAGLLCGSLESGEAERIHRTLEGLAADHSGKVCFVAGADLAHLGPMFGDPDPIDAAARAALAARDAARIEHLAAGDANGLRAAIDRDANADRICSVTALQLVGALGGPSAAPPHYGQTPPSPEQVVSFVGAVHG